MEVLVAPQRTAFDLEKVGQLNLPVAGVNLVINIVAQLAWAAGRVFSLALFTRFSFPQLRIGRMPPDVA